MKSTTLYLIFFAVAFFSCNRQSKLLPTFSIKDTVLKEYVSASENDPFFETDKSFEILKAYYTNDTITLSNFHKAYLRYIAEKENNHFDSCITQPELQKSDALEAYRFKYSKAFCQELVNITVYKKKESATLHFINFYARVDMADCRIIKEYDKELTTNEWMKIESAIQHSDFWALKYSNDTFGFDGGDLTLIGFKKNGNLDGKPKFHTVNRWSPESTDIFTPFLVTLQLSGYKGCLSP